MSLNVKGCGLLFSVYIWICKYESSLLYMHTCIRDLTDIEIQFCHRRRRGRSPPTRSEYRLAVTNLSTRCSWQVRLTYMIKAAALEWMTDGRSNNNPIISHFFHTFTLSALLSDHLMLLSIFIPKLIMTSSKLYRAMQEGL